MGISYEFHADATQPGLERLWREATDWGEATLDTLRRWFEVAPFGKPRIVVATDDETGEMVGQFRFMPSRVCVNGEVVRAVRPFGTIVTPAMRDAVKSNNPLQQPAVAMYFRAVDELKAVGEQFIYMVPDPRWMRLFQMLPFLQTGTFPLWSLPLPLAKPYPLGEEGYTFGSLEKWDERVDRLWEKSSRLHGCTVLRDAETLKWKLANGNYETTAIERDGELVGLVASRRKGDRQWLVCDVLAADGREAMRATLAAACNVGHEKSLTAGEGQEAILKVAVLATPLMETVVRDLGFRRDAYDFPLVVHVLDENVPAENVAPARWYVSAND
ncbi:MAG: hypothetical protein WKF74_10530 [Pyrinomonadaceae bacterium]